MSPTKTASNLLHRRSYEDVTQTTFNTPMVRLQRVIPPSLAEVFVKCEFFNPMGSVKDRIGLAMIEAGERDGHVTPETHIVEPTSGNTGIALAFVCAARGYKLTLTMPETMSLERRALLRGLGARLILTPDDQGMGAAIARAIDLTNDDAGAWMPMQFENPANPAVHEATTGPEIWEDSGGNIDAIVAGVGTGGTITGVTRFLRRQNPNFMAIAVEPENSAVISGAKPGMHEIQGIGAGFIPRNCDTSLLDGIVKVSDEEAYTFARRLPVEEGIFGGISTGANVCATAKAIEKFGLEGKRVVTIGCSFGERYLSTRLFEGLRD
ncbi:MAG: cysteine synthase A [Phycisphaerae bacterium]|nr:cysteine synthase A [Phycisphaerae bacterium]